MEVGVVSSKVGWKNNRHKGDSEQLEVEMCYVTPCLQINNTLQAFLTGSTDQ